MTSTSQIIITDAKIRRMRERLRWTCCACPFPRKERLTPGPFCPPATETRRRDSRFSPRSFFGSIKNIDGRIFVSLDTCFTGMSNRRPTPRWFVARRCARRYQSDPHTCIIIFVSSIYYTHCDKCSLISTSWYLYEINSHLVYNVIFLNFLNFRCNKDHIILFNIIRL